MLFKGPRRNAVARCGPTGPYYSDWSANLHSNELFKTDIPYSFTRRGDYLLKTAFY